MRFSPDFLFGTANADHQVEAYDPACEDVWDAWEREQGLTPRGRGTDFANRYEEDVRAAAEMGCRLFRFSVSWARVEPRDGGFDEAALDHYRAVASCIRNHGMKVMLTLHHFVWPVWLERERGGLTGADFPDLFARHARRLSEHLGDLVDYWITFNEPSQLTFGYIKPWWRAGYYMPPGLTDGADVDAEAEAVGQLIPNLFLAHTRARAAIRGVRPEAKVGVNPLMTGFPIWLQMLMDWGACHQSIGEALFKFTTKGPLVGRQRRIHRKNTQDVVVEAIGAGPRWLRPLAGWLNWAWRFWGTTTLIANANWWYLGMSGRLAEELCPAEAVGAQDFVGLDYYWGLPTWRLHKFRSLEDAAHGRFLHAPVWPRGLYHSLRRMHRWFPEMDILIVENGSVPVASGVPRAEYMKRHLREVLAALDKGVPVKAYNFWSITSNREWGHPFDPNTDFGLYHVDLDGDPALTRHATPDVEVYREIIAKREVQ